jgi:multisubunit Na+/H+ antiporter MnhF subunit
MQAFLTLAALALLINAGVAVWAMLHAKSAAAHVLPLLLLGTNASAIVLLLAEVMNEPAARDIAFVFAVLAALTSLAFSHRLWWRLPKREER